MKRLFIFFTLFLILSAHLLQSKVLILRWKDADIYNDALKGLESAGITDYTLIDCKGEKNNASDALKKASDYDAVIILGESPLKIAVSENVKKPVFYGMVYNPSLIVSNKENISGVSLNISFSKQMEIIKKILPSASSIGVLYSKEELINNLSEEAEKKGLSLKKFKAVDDKDVNDKINSIKEVSVILMLSDPIISSSGVISSLMLQSQKIKSPLFVSSDKLVKSGALFGLAPSYNENGKSLGRMVKKYLETKEIPPSAKMDDGDLYINLKTLKDMKITIEDIVIKQAKETYK